MNHSKHIIGFVGLSVLLHGALLYTGTVAWQSRTPFSTPASDELSLLLQPNNSITSATETTREKSNTITDTMAPPQPNGSSTSEPNTNITEKQTAKIALAQYRDVQYRDTQHRGAPHSDTQTTASTSIQLETTTEEETSDSFDQQTSQITATRDPHQLENKLRHQITQALSQHFSYPRIARKRGWQGDVTVSLRIEADGQVTQVKLLESSGYNILDMAALRSLKQLATLPQAIRLLQQQSMDITLPIHYRLVDAT